MGEAMPSKPQPLNESIVSELHFYSAKKGRSTSRGAQLRRSGLPPPEKGVRSLGEPPISELCLSESDSDGDEASEEEDEEGGVADKGKAKGGAGADDESETSEAESSVSSTAAAAAPNGHVLKDAEARSVAARRERVAMARQARERQMAKARAVEKQIDHPLEDALDDMGWKEYPLTVGQGGDSKDQFDGGVVVPQKRHAGYLKLRARVIEAPTPAHAEAFVRPPGIRRVFAKGLYSVRLHVYRAHLLRQRRDGQPPQPFVRVSNGPDQMQTQSTRDQPAGATLEPHFYASFDLPAILPGDSTLSIELLNYSLFGDTVIGGTRIDLEERLCSEQWQAMQRIGALPRESRELVHPASGAHLGKVIIRLEILERRLALQNPMVSLAPPVRERFELRCVVWSLSGLTPHDDTGGGVNSGKIDVFCTVQPRSGSSTEVKSHTSLTQVSHKSHTRLTHVSHKSRTPHISHLWPSHVFPPCHPILSSFSFLSPAGLAHLCLLPHGGRRIATVRSSLCRAAAPAARRVLPLRAAAGSRRPRHRI